MGTMTTSKILPVARLKSPFICLYDWFQASAGASLRRSLKASNKTAHLLPSPTSCPIGEFGGMLRRLAEKPKAAETDSRFSPKSGEMARSWCSCSWRITSTSLLGLMPLSTASSRRLGDKSGGKVGQTRPFCTFIPAFIPTFIPTFIPSTPTFLWVSRTLLLLRFESLKF